MLQFGEILDVLWEWGEFVCWQVDEFQKFKLLETLGKIRYKIVVRLKLLEKSELSECLWKGR